MELGDMNDFAIEQILKWLPPKQLLECGRTCKRLQRLSRNTFRRKHSVKEAQKITLLDNGNLRISPSTANYLKYFDNIIRNLTISSWNFQQNKDFKLENVMDFMLKKCDWSLSKICIVGDMELMLFGQRIDEKFRNVRAVEFQNRRGAVDEAQFLKHCRNLRKLILGVEINNENVDAILGQRYQQLTHFYYLYGNGKNLNAEKLQVFFRINEQIQSIVWKMRMFDKCARHHFVKCVQTLGHAKHLQHFRLCFAGHLTEYTTQQFNAICTQLNLLCERDTFKFLEIELIHPPFNDDFEMLLWRMNCFANWKQLIKIHLQYFKLPLTIPTILKLVHLKFIVFDKCNWNYDDDELDNDHATMEVPQIEEVVMKNDQSDLTMLCMPLVRYWKNLNTIIVPVYCNDVELDIRELNRTREELKDACELTIITNPKNLQTNLNHKLVKLKCGNSIHRMKHH